MFARRDPRLLLHLSDTHFGTEQRAVMQALLRLAQAQRPALVIASGDITQRARRTQFDAARAFFDELGPPSLVIPGNHDLPLMGSPRRLAGAYADYERAFGTDRAPRMQLERAWIAAVDTTRAWRHKHGAVSREQADEAARWLQGAPADVLRVVVTHQPAAALLAKDEPDCLRGAREAARRWSAAGVHLVLGGHIHRPYVMPLHARWPELPAPLWLAQAGTAFSSRTRPGIGPSVNLIRQVRHDEWRVERWDWRATSDGFELESAQRIALLDGPSAGAATAPASQTSGRGDGLPSP